MIKLQQHSYRCKKCFLKLGIPYRIETVVFGCKSNQSNYILIRTGGKGFNLLNINNYSCLFHRPIYQTDSKEKHVSYGQKYFEMILPNWIQSIEEIKDGTKTEKHEEISTTKICLNALYRMELNEN